MGLLKDSDKEQLVKSFKNMKNDVTIILFTQEFECQFCKATRELMEELSELSVKINLEIHDFVKEADLAKRYSIDKIPGFALIGEKDYGIRFFGVPAGYEFTTLIEDILDISNLSTNLGPEILDELAKVDKPVHMQAMVSPTCPYCPRAVRIVHRFAIASDFIRGDMVEISEFPQLLQKYGIQGVPHTIINEEFSVVGALPEMDFVKEIMRAIGKQ